MRTLTFLLIIIASTCFPGTKEKIPLPTDEMDIFIHMFKERAIEEGISPKTVDLVLDSTQYNPTIIRLLNTQPEFIQSFWSYIDKRVTPYRINKGRELLKKHRTLLNTVSRKYGVPPHIILSLWGIESDFSKNTGNLKLANSLVTLCIEKKRSKFFQKELLSLLQLVDRNFIPHDTKGSWGGAMGGIQFMPSNVLQYAKDGNKDGSIDIWSCEEDIFESTANFLTILGWQRGYKWGREVQLPDEYEYFVSGLEIKKAVSDWSALGVKAANGSDLPESKISASLLLPNGYKGPAFLVYENFRIIMKWNKSEFFALSTCLLSDKLIHDTPILSKRGDEKAIRKKDILFIQNKLIALGFDVGKADGYVGSKTKRAVKAYQLKYGLKADGHVGSELYEHLLSTH